MRTIITALAGLTLGCSSSPLVPSDEPLVLEVAFQPVQTPVDPVAPVEDVSVERLEVSALAPVTSFHLRRGETLAHFARWAEVPVESVAQSSGLGLEGTYAVGTELRLSLDAEQRSSVLARRESHHRRRANNYLESRNSATTELYTVRSGDSAWGIATARLGMPVWMLETLNPHADLDALRPGQELLVPVFNDVVVEAPALTEPE